MSHYNPDPNKKVNLTIDGLPVTVPEGTTILEAARKVNVNIPNLCNCSGLGKRAVCRLCVVECDGRGKLLPACSNDVWEGVSVVTNSLRLLNIRKTILELLLTEHPPECLSCVKNKKCELQSLAAAFGIREIPYSRRADKRRPRKMESSVLVRDMSKCIKCGRCVEACQEIQTVRAINSSCRGADYEICAPYGQELIDSACVFCGQCAAVCPVGAIFEHDDTAEVQAALNDSSLHTAVLIMPPAIGGIEKEFDLPSGSISGGTLVTALKRMGFAKVFSSEPFANLSIKEERAELIQRINNGGQLPMISGCSPAHKNFIQKFYSDLVPCLPASRNPARMFMELLRENYPESAGMEKTKIRSVSIVPCISQKWETRRTEGSLGRGSPTVNSDTPRSDFSLTPQEIARMINTAGIDLRGLPESPYDEFPCVSQGQDSSGISGGTSKRQPGTELKADEGFFQSRVYGAYTGRAPKLPAFGEVAGQEGIKEAIADLDGKKLKILSVSGLANARAVLDTVRKGECDAMYIEIVSCSLDKSCPIDNGISSNGFGEP